MFDYTCITWNGKNEREREAAANEQKWNTVAIWLEAQIEKTYLKKNRYLVSWVTEQPKLLPATQCHVPPWVKSKCWGRDTIIISLRKECSNVKWLKVASYLLYFCRCIFLYLVTRECQSSLLDCSALQLLRNVLQIGEFFHMRKQQ